MRITKEIFIAGGPAVLYNNLYRVIDKKKKFIFVPRCLPF